MAAAQDWNKELPRTSSHLHLGTPMLATMPHSVLTHKHKGRRSPPAEHGHVSEQQRLVDKLCHGATQIQHAQQLQVFALLSQHPGSHPLQKADGGLRKGMVSETRDSLALGGDKPAGTLTDPPADPDSSPEGP